MIRRAMTSLLRRVFPLVLVAGAGTAALADGEVASAGRVSHYIPAGERQALVMIEGFGKGEVAAGDVLLAQRPSSAPGGIVVEGPDRPVTTGRVKVLQLQEASALGTVLDDGTAMSRQLFPKFPGIMAGDILVREQARIEANIVLAPTLTLTYDKIFADPNPGAQTFELSDQGRQVIADLSASLSVSRLSRIMVEGYTDTRGASELNQIESLQRALTIRQHMIVSLGFDPDRVVAVGLGESEPVAGPRVPDSARLNRRIVIKALPVLPSQQ